MPGQKNEFKNWVQAGRDAGIDILQKGTDFAASIHNRDKMVVVVPALPDGSVAMGNVYRAALDEITTEFPSRHYDEDEDHQAIAHQLCRVHSESAPTEIVYLGEILPFPGVLDLRIHLYACRIPGSQSGRLVAPEGMLDIRAYSTQELTEAIAKGAMCDAPTIACLMRYMACRTTTPGPTPTLLKEIEFLDHSGQVIGGARTNKPEWSFLQFSTHNIEAVEWRFKDSPQSSSPMGNNLPVKPSLAMLGRRFGAFKPAPAYAAEEQDPGQNENPDDALAKEASASNTPESAEPASEISPAPAFLSTRRPAPEGVTEPSLQSSSSHKAAAPRRRMTLSMPDASRTEAAADRKPQGARSKPENTGQSLVAQRAVPKSPASPDLEKVLRDKMESVRRHTSSLQGAIATSALKRLFRKPDKEDRGEAHSRLIAPRPAVYGVQKGIEDIMAPGPSFVRMDTHPGTDKES